MRPTPDLDKRILHHFFGFHFVDEHSHEQRINQAASAVIEHAQRLLVSFGDCPEQSRVLPDFRVRQIPSLAKPHHPFLGRFHALHCWFNHQYIRSARQFGCRNFLNQRAPPEFIPIFPNQR